MNNDILKVLYSKEEIDNACKSWVMKSLKRMRERHPL